MDNLYTYSWHIILTVIKCLATVTDSTWPGQKYIRIDYTRVHRYRYVQAEEWLYWKQIFEGLQREVHEQYNFKQIVRFISYSPGLNYVEGTQLIILTSCKVNADFCLFLTTYLTFHKHDHTLHSSILNAERYTERGAAKI